MNFTPEQQKAIQAPGNTLVLAGAGSGKTRTLVERCARLLLDSANPVSVREILIVTFNEAAAAEVRERLRARLVQQSAAGGARVREQLALLDMAQISTLHSFCFLLLREHFYALDLDPGVSVLDETQARVLFLRAIEELLAEHYSGAHPFSAELTGFMRSHLRGWAQPLIEFVRAVHEFTQTRPDPEAWFARQLELLERDDPAHWRKWFDEALGEWARGWIRWLSLLPAENSNAAPCCSLLGRIAHGEAGALKELLERDSCWPSKKKSVHRKPFGAMFDEAAFLASLGCARGDPLREDWEWSRKPLRPLLLFARQFAERFAAAKQDRTALDFHDLEQGALKLLWENGQPSAIARLCRSRFKAVFVDEYQDINSVQDRIIRAVSRENRFLVGDNKQSIYRFRQADPSIFRSYLQETEGWEQAFLSENFRSHEGVIDFINPLFSWLMRQEMGGVSYDSRSVLRFADTAERALLRRPRGSEPQVELNIIYTDGEPEPPAEENGDAIVEFENAEKEARLVALRLRELKETGFCIADQGRMRPVRWRDMVVLLRAGAGKLEVYAKAFEAAGVPLHTKQNAFYTTQEIHDLCNILSLLDNPLQDIPLAAVLRSPLVGMTANEMAWIRIVSKARPLWNAVGQYIESSQNPDPSGRVKLEAFVAQFQRWRGERSSASLAQRIERILAETGYDDWLLSQPRGPQRCANVRQLLRIARHFDEVRGESLYLFLRHIQELQDAVGDIEPAPAVQENAVRLMTVHQSKGLEFPVVAAPDLGKRFNQSDARTALLIDETYGVCATIKPPDTGKRYPSLPLWLARRRQKIETLGEEIRLMYVAFTRAQNRLLLFGSTTEKKTGEAWTDLAVPEPLPNHLLRASCWLDWLGACIQSAHPGWLQRDEGRLPTLDYKLHRSVPPLPPAQAQVTTAAISQSDLAESERRLRFNYPHRSATLLPAKTSVSRLRMEQQEMDDEARVWRIGRAGKRDGRQRGLAFHAFLEHLDLSAPLNRQGLGAQAERLVQNGLIARDEAEIDLDSAAEFWAAPLGREIIQARANVRRELPFTFKLTGEVLRQAGLGLHFDVPDDDFLILQGVVDLAVILPAEIWLVDFKTDEISAAEVSAATELHRAQIALYAAALAAIYKRPVTRQVLYFVHPRMTAAP